MVIAMMICCTTGAMGATPPQPLLPIPTPQQLEWQDTELAMFIHFTINAYTDREWGEGTEDPKIFNPVRLDARQWVRAAKDAGFKLVIITAKHHDGFCLWPSAYTDHSVKSSPWRDGKGDVVGELAAACREAGVRMGVYLSPWDRHEPTYGDSPAYNAHFCNQLTELLTNYGPIAEVWFDGACGEGPNGKRQVYDWTAYRSLIRRLQPDAIIWSDAGPDARWIGNEHGTAGEPCWAMMRAGTVDEPGKSGDDVIAALQHGDENGTEWRPGECDVSIRPGWFWHKKEDDKVKTVDQLVDIYLKSVGRNCNLLLNVPPNTDGLFSDADVQRLAQFRARLDAMFQTDLARGKGGAASCVRGGDAAFGASGATDGDTATYWAADDGVTSGWLEADLGGPVTFNLAEIQEPICLGQRVKGFRIDYLEGDQWKTAARGATIGHKRLERFAPVTATRVRLVIEDARACPVISTFALYHWAGK